MCQLPYRGAASCVHDEDVSTHTPAIPFVDRVDAMMLVAVALMVTDFSEYQAECNRDMCIVWAKGLLDVRFALFTVPGSS